MASKLSLSLDNACLTATQIFNRMQTVWLWLMMLSLSNLLAIWPFLKVSAGQCWTWRGKSPFQLSEKTPYPTGWTRTEKRIKLIFIEREDVDSLSWTNCVKSSFNIFLLCPAKEPKHLSQFRMNFCWTVYSLELGPAKMFTFRLARSKTHSRLTETLQTHFCMGSSRTFKASSSNWLPSPTTYRWVTNLPLNCRHLSFSLANHLPIAQEQPYRETYWPISKVTPCGNVQT